MVALLSLFVHRRLGLNPPQSDGCFDYGGCSCSSSSTDNNNNNIRRKHIEMAFRPLTEADCGQKNPLIHLASHVTRDHTFSESHGHLFPSSSEDQLVEQFLQETRALPQTFRMDDLMREMHEIESQRSALPPVPASTVKDHLQHDDAWAQQYIEDGKVFHVNNVEQNAEAVWGESASQSTSQINEPPPDLVASTLSTSTFDRWLDNNLQENNLIQLSPKEFWSSYLQHQQQQPGGSSSFNVSQLSAKQLTDSLDDPKFEYSKFMKFMKQVGDGEISLEEKGKLSEQEVQSWSEEFMTNEAKEGEILDDNWPKQSVVADEDEFKSQFWDNLQDELKDLGTEYESGEHPWMSDYESYLGGAYKEYAFSDDNPMFDVANALVRGKELLNEGDLPSAVLCFEVAVKQQPDNPEVWLLLGKTQSENEQDPNAIPALKQCLQLDSGNLTALMALAICYTNESYYNLAGQTLVKWLANNPKYSDLVPGDFKPTTGNQHKTIQDLFIKAAQRQPNNDIDYEIQCGLGVLCNLSGEYDKAADCFRSALSVNPNDAKLWNRLGATLANGSKSEEAVEAYHRALSLEPGFIRARYNVGIVCINLRAYKEAAEHFLTALNQQARGKKFVVGSSGVVSQMSDTIWSTFRMCISLMNRSDLRPAIDNKDLQSLNREFDIVN